MSLYRRDRSPYWWMDVSTGEPPIRQRLSTKRPHEMGSLPLHARPRTKEQREAFRLAQAVEQEYVKRALDRDQLGVREAITLGDALTRLLAESRHMPSYVTLESRAKKLIGARESRFSLSPGLMLHQLTTAHVERLRAARLAEGMKPASINTEVSLISRLINVARDRWQVRAPQDVTINRYKTQPKLRYLTSEEEARLLAELEPEENANKAGQDQYDLTLFLLDTGARYGEVAGITWAAIDTNDWKTVNIYRSKVGNEGILTMTNRLREALQRRWEKRPNSPYVFTNREGGPRNYTTYGIRKAIERANLNEPHLVARFGTCTVHSFRDTFATKCLRVGLSLYEVSKLLGHASTTMTQKYAHLEMTDVANAAAAGLDQLNGVAA